jgi:N-acetyl-gamma-glutamyl-phosphate reductase
MIKAAIIGASGYSGAELVRILAAHPSVEVSAITSTSRQGEPLSALYPNLTGLVDLEFSAYSPSLADNDVVFLALPHGNAMDLVPELRKAGPAKLIDLSGDFRLPADVYEQWYKRPHSSPEMIGAAAYGLSELNRELIAQADLVANPGCFPTGILLAVAPLLTDGLIGGTLVANCLTGVSGAGRALSEASQFCRADENAAAYKAGGVHQHVPEIEAAFALCGPVDVKLSFTPILAPFSRGIYVTAGAALAAQRSLEEIHETYVNFYAGRKFVKVLPPGRFAEVKATAGSNFCHVSLAVDPRSGWITAMSSIDNLVKGAAGQAIQNMNILFGLDEGAGLTQPGLYP